MSAGRYLAAERAAFEADAPEETPAEDSLTQAAVAPLEEIAAMHMSTERAISFIRWMENLEKP